jgi:pimeloyl-ACP methyl ester carboxylesterase
VTKAVLNFKRGYSKCFLGQIHYREHGEGDPVLCLHQSPQSSGMFDTVLPMLGKHFRTICMDTIGYGMSDRPGRMVEPEEYGRTILEFLDDMGLTDPIPVIGVHTGAYFATQLAVQAPERVSKIVLSGPVLLHPEGAEVPMRAPATFPVPDGSHLTNLWNLRWKNVAPVANIEAFEKLYVAALTAGEQAQAAYYAATKLDTLKQLMEEVKVPAYMVWGDRDLSAPGIVRCLPLITDKVPDYKIVGGTLDTIEEFPQEWTDACVRFIKGS